MSESIDPKTRLEELFIADLLFGLTKEEQQELDALRAAEPEHDLQSIAGVIAALDDRFQATNEMRLPAHLRERIRADALKVLPQPGRNVFRQEPSRRTSRLPWTIATVCAALMLAAFATTWVLWQAQRPGAPLSQRDRLIASAEDLVRVSWTDGPTPVPNASGDIAWSTQAQQGYMQFRGMRVNDPTVEQYQLWIFDRNQDEKTPIDGGVFNITSNGEIVVPIKAALRVREPYLFAVTIEKPGGVVVSDRSRLPLLATVKP